MNLKKTAYLTIALILQISFLYFILNGAEEPPYFTLIYNRYIGQNLLFIRIIHLLTIYIILPAILIYFLLTRKYYFSILSFFLTIVILLILKNLYVYYFVYDSYNKNQYTFFKEQSTTWRTEFITHTDIVDEYLLKKCIKFETDSSGVYKENMILEKIDGLYTKFNWRHPRFNSLLPYSNKSIHTANYKFEIKSNHFIIKSITSKFQAFDNSYILIDKYQKYKIIDDTLFLDINSYDNFYIQDPVFEKNRRLLDRLNIDNDNSFPWHLFNFWQ